MAQPQVRIVSSLGDVDQALQDLNINNVNQVGLVRFELHERASLKAATMINRRTRPGRLGFKLVNPELLECKTSAKTALENSFNSMLDASIRRFDQEMHAVEGSIGTLRALVLNTDDQMPHNPPFSEFPHFERRNQKVSYQVPYDTQEQWDAAAARDRRAQRALWQTKLRILETRYSILKDMKLEMLSRMRAEFKTIMEEPSDLGAGYAVDGLPPLV